MTQDERLDYLLRYLLAERKEYTEIHGVSKIRDINQ